MSEDLVTEAEESLYTTVTCLISIGLLVPLCVFFFFSVLKQLSQYSTCTFL